MSISTIPISVVIPTFKRVDCLRDTLNNILICNPRPDEIIVHVEKTDSETIDVLSNIFPDVHWISSAEIAGPGGARDKAIKACKNELIASFDDDSYPDISINNYFEILYSYFEKFPEVMIIESTIYHRTEKLPLRVEDFKRIFLFTGCGAAYRKSLFIQAGGYVPVQPAYGIEETDLALRAYALQYIFIRSQDLIVFHNTDLKHHLSAKINASYITNLALLAFLRYPITFWGYGCLQIFNRILWALKHKRLQGLLKGLFIIPYKCFQYRKYRNIIDPTVIKSFLSNRQNIHQYGS